MKNGKGNSGREVRVQDAVPSKDALLTPRVYRALANTAAGCCCPFAFALASELSECKHAHGQGRTA